MKILIQQVNIISSGSPYNGMCKDVLIVDGLIHQIADQGTIVETCDELIDGRNKCLTPGWLDLHVNFREPGNEHKEDISSGCKAAQQGGYTGVVHMPSTNPPVHTRSAVEFILNRAKHELVDVFPAGTISYNQEGKDLSEMYDMFTAGARIFTDDKKAVADAGLLLRALLYTQNFGGKIFVYPNDRTISAKGQMHEGINSTNLGLKGIPAIAEEIMIARDLVLAEYTNAEIHFSTISSGKSVDLIRAAKKKGLKVTTDVSSMNISLDDDSLKKFETNYKLLPPLRTHSDIKALIEGLNDGTIDAICSDHSPEDVENKKKEFELAEFGAEGLETSFAAAYTVLKDHLSAEKIIEKFTVGPRKVMALPQISIKENELANLTLVDLEAKWTVTSNDLYSKSKNNPFLERSLQSKVNYVFNKNTLYKCR